MDNPPGSPPPMSPPPAYPGPAYYPPPAPPQKSNTLKWVLIGCGVFAGLIILVCGGFIVWSVLVAKSMKDAQVEIEKRIRGSAAVEQELGPVKTVKLTGQGSSGQNPTLTFRVRGDNAGGTVEATLVFTGMSFKVGDVTLTTEDNREIELENPSPP